ncbi:helix-turn-helix domain-containing protein [Heyndrickxia oleronia]|uniref:helix-turn-helix domain-containing protein n=1 Tax=Heyndrickxia oleronia TaxID=38875 RepID=UPI00242ADCE5|nr:helix-turn-helix transcriptional regulator [Heyndrickxia oleronia]MCI1593077.1 helix-turn-helix transcriptional regulator [Heyndrickxia oleronia]MCI1615487.1 helix-turn-helix transcriptional regulator [Heyndrickxia oleronia]MCI1746163.1 helix-turn-helix transcriptional regulator [Heyndrickxia oleronia]MCI1763546.1 helix-turn-helix transcriptional regulator [Heyndrickxia oleronia]
MENKQFQINVQTALILREMTMTEVAKKLGISVPYLSDIVKGNRKGEKYKKQISDLLGFQYKSKED